MNPGLSPIVEIEKRVQELAKASALDLSTSEGSAELRALIDTEIDRWNQAHKRGLRPHPLVDVNAVSERIGRNLTGYGPLTELLEDDDVWEIMVNAPDAIFVRRHSGPSGYHHESFHDDDHVIRTVTRLLDDSSMSHRKLDVAAGLQDAQLESGARVHIVHQDIARGGHLMLNIRKFTGVAFSDLSELVENGMLDEHAARFLRTAVRAGLSMVVSGAPGSGKTTLLSCCAAEIDPAKRVVVAEEVFEADVPLANVAGMQTRPARSDRVEIDLRRLVSGFLRMAPDVAIVGEVRDREALPLLLTLSSGVTGFTTIHAGSAHQALTRLRFVCQLADAGRDLPLSALNALVSESVDVVVHCARGEGGPRVTEIICVEDNQVGPEANRFTVSELFAREGIDTALRWTGQIPVRAAKRMEAAGFDTARLFRYGEGLGR